MVVKTGKRFRRRRPTQRRARQTVEAVLDAVVRMLKREGVAAITTNRIAEVAGVSIGSLYQYFPDKQAIFVALHQRHVEQIDRMVARTLVEHAESPLDELMRAMIEAMIDAHREDPQLYEFLLTEVPHRADGTRDFAAARRVSAGDRCQNKGIKEQARSRHPDLYGHSHGGIACAWSVVSPAAGAFPGFGKARSCAGRSGVSAFVTRLASSHSSTPGGTSGWKQRH